MSRYQVWDKKKPIITPSGAQFTADEWADRYPWIKIPGQKMIITADPINGGCAENFDNFVALRKRQGVEITDGMTDDEILAAIEAWEDNPPDPGPSVEERTAAALEFIALNSLPDEV